MSAARRFFRRAQRSLALGLSSLLLVGLSGCGLSSKVNRVLDQADNEAAKSCECNWQFLQYGSEDECIADQTTTPSERDCVQRVIAESEDNELNERVLDCYSRAYDDLSVCNSALSCNENLEWAACSIDFAIDIGQCPDTDSQVAIDVANCLAN